jgi:cytochrome b561
LFRDIRLESVQLYLQALVTTLMAWALAGTIRSSLTRDLSGIPFPLIVASHEHAIHKFLACGPLLACVLAFIVAVHIAGALRYHFHQTERCLVPVGVSGT